MGNMKKAPVGRSSKTDMGRKNPPAGGEVGKLHRAGKTVPLFNAARIDKMENKGSSGKGGVKS